jgi:hypothetical protein
MLWKGLQFGNAPFKRGDNGTINHDSVAFNVKIRSGAMISVASQRGLTIERFLNIVLHL